MREAVLSMGSNLGNRMENLRHALRAVGCLPGTEVLSVSKYYETDPVEVGEQPMFINNCVRIMTALSPRALLGACLGIESSMGRYRTGQKTARVIDIDVLLMEGIRKDDAELTLPHPRMLHRAFVLIPLADLYPSKEVLGLSFARELGRMDCSGVFPCYEN